MARGCNVDALPMEQRIIGLPTDEKKSLGRERQVGYFEALLSSEPRFLTCVSRNHVELSAAPGEPLGTFDVVNLSVNPVVIAGRTLSKGDRGVLKLLGSIDFIAASAGAEQPVCYLRLNLDTWGSSSSTAQPQRVETPPQIIAASHAASTPPLAKTPQPALAPPSYVAEAQAPVVASSASSQPRPKAPPSTHQPAADILEEKTVPMLPSRPESLLKNEAPFSLVLGGSAVKQDVPISQRKLLGSDDGLTVGRAHQQALLNPDCLLKEVLKYVSRNHFRVESAPRRSGAWQLKALSSNPIWRARNGKLVELNEGDQPLSVEASDDILLFTGADDCTPDGPGNNGLLNFTFFQENIDDEILRVREGMADRSSTALGDAIRSGDRSPRSRSKGAVGGRSPRAASPRRVAFSDEGGGSGAGALRAPFSGRDLGRQEDAAYARGDVSTDAEVSLGDVNDKFASSGFRY